ncbi:MAG: hypothetical protein IPL52_16935 [Flavobacteriales bacterium]|nr:hypothetical protein [Flavobacteriales bacterium]
MNPLSVIDRRCTARGQQGRVVTLIGHRTSSHCIEDIFITQWPDDAEKDKDKRNAINTIRLITRLMFVWFLREKNLVPDALFVRGRGNWAKE